MSNKETAKKEIENLVRKYKLVVNEGRIAEYNESNTRKDFILPLFSALGWDITNINEVYEETRISRDRVDYSFNLINIPKFYLEAKALKADLDKQEYAQQAIDYAYNKGVPWAVLTDFEKIKVFNAEWKAKTLQDSQFLEITYNEYLDRFDELWLLSKESLTQGLLDKEAERRLKKDKKQPISKQILSDLLKAREKLTKNILERPRLNKVSEEELDESVQRILDRLIFIRTSEDRVIEQNHLLSAVRLWKEKGGNLWEKLKKIFRDFDTGYNSKLFEKHLSEDLIIDDGVLAEIIESLYQTPDGSRYDFSAISADVLGSIYEQYLGHILKKTPKSARLKETHQHRKEMGIYYTPTYIVDYIVKNTLGEVLKKTKPKDANKIKVLDPACGSGSFLIRAFDEFLNYWQRKSPGEFGYFRKIEILKNNLYGVDLDKQAVEIAQMNLLLKTLYRRQQLPMLEHIKQGNSLISGSEEELKKYFAENRQSKHPFNWEKEFPKVFSNGCHCERERSNLGSQKIRSEESQNGFDVVIGNPPYVKIHRLPNDDIEYYRSYYRSAIRQFDIFCLMIERGLSLLREGGRFGFIVPSLFLKGEQYSALRKFVLENTNIQNIVDFGDKVFEGVQMPTCVIVFEKTAFPKKKHRLTFEQRPFQRKKIIGQFVYEKSDGFKFAPTDELVVTILEKLKKNSMSVGAFFRVTRGLELSKRHGGIHKERLPNAISLLSGEDIDRYRIKSMKYIEKSVLQQFLKEREIFEKPKIIVRETGNRIVATYDNTKTYTLRTIYNMVLTGEDWNLKYVLGILNSSLVQYIYAFKYKAETDIFPKIRIEQVRQIPIRKIDFSNPAEKIMHDDLVKLVERMLELNKQLQKFGDRLTDERRKIESEIQKTDNEIDELVYKLYGLTDEEIKIVEGSLE